MKWHRDLVHGFAVELHWSYAATNEGARFHCSAQTDNGNMIAIIDFEFSSELGRHFCERLRLQFSEMTQETRHSAGGVMLGEPVSCKNKRKSRIARRRE